MIKSYPISPVAAPRQCRSDRWAPSPQVLRYRAFKDEVRLHQVSITAQCAVSFYIPMPPSWSDKKRAEYLGKPHQQKPDIDNLLKALFDAVFEDDAHIWSVDAEKRWGLVGSIVIGSFT